MEVYDTYVENQFAANVKYLGKRLKVELGFVDEKGGYGDVRMTVGPRTGRSYEPKTPTVPQEEPGFV